jgi:hypothetical protein
MTTDCPPVPAPGVFTPEVVARRLERQLAGRA